MKQDIKELWVEALRSGRYEQGTGVLVNEENYCCLGVLCDIAIREGLPLEVSFNGDGVKCFNGVGVYLPYAVREWAGLDRDNPRVYLSDDLSDESLSLLNDSWVSFHQIADVIEYGL